MKPTPQISSKQRKPRSFPLTDYQYQTSALSAGRAIAKKTPSALELKTFRKLSTEFFATETPRDYIAELFFFILNHRDRSLADHFQHGCHHKIG